MENSITVMKELNKHDGELDKRNGELNKRNDFTKRFPQRPGGPGGPNVTQRDSLRPHGVPWEPHGQASPFIQKYQAIDRANLKGLFFAGKKSPAGNRAVDEDLFL